MRIIKEFILYQAFEIIRINIVLKPAVSIIAYYMNKWLLIVIEPAVKYLKTYHKSLRVSSEISFPVFKLKQIDRSAQRIFVEFSACKPIKVIFYDRYEFILSVYISFLGDY